MWKPAQVPRKPNKRPLKFDAQAFEKLSLPEKIQYLKEFIAALNASLASEAPHEDGGKKKSGGHR